jgi:hypothetical protein
MTKQINYFGLTLTIPQNTKQIIVEKDSLGRKRVYAFNLMMELTWDKDTKSWSLADLVDGARSWFTYIELTGKQQSIVNKIKPSKSLVILPRGAQQ